MDLTCDCLLLIDILIRAAVLALAEPHSRHAARKDRVRLAIRLIASLPLQVPDDC